MKEKTTKVYSCDHCSKKLFRKYSMELHEKMCWSNPENSRPCLSCPHLTKETVKIYLDHPFLGDIERDVSIFKCAAKEIFLHTPRNEYKGNKFELGEEENYPMPKQCNEYDELQHDYKHLQNIDF